MDDHTVRAFVRPSRPAFHCLALLRAFRLPAVTDEVALAMMIGRAGRQPSYGGAGRRAVERRVVRRWENHPRRSEIQMIIGGDDARPDGHGRPDHGLIMDTYSMNALRRPWRRHG
jgi:hypothetical protein